MEGYGLKKSIQLKTSMWNSNFYLFSDDQNYGLKNHIDIPMTI